MPRHLNGKKIVFSTRGEGASGPTGRGGEQMNLDINLKINIKIDHGTKCTI